MQFGYAQAQVMYHILKKACANKDLTAKGSAGLAAASGIETGGLVAGPLDYTKSATVDAPIYLAGRADVPGGLKSLEGTFESATAKSYQFKG